MPPKTAPAPQRAEEKAQPETNPWPPAPLPTPAELPEGTGHGHSPDLGWPTLTEAAKPYKNLK